MRKKPDSLVGSPITGITRGITTSEERWLSLSRWFKDDIDIYDETLLLTQSD